VTSTKNSSDNKKILKPFPEEGVLDTPFQANSAVNPLNGQIIDKRIAAGDLASPQGFIAKKKP